MSVQAKKQNDSLDLNGTTAVVAGGTQGIGEGVAIRFAQLGVSRIFILGRNEQKANDVLSKLKEAANHRAKKIDGGSPNDERFEFLNVDLSTVKAVKTAASNLQSKLGDQGVDYLVMTQGGTPNGLYEENEEGLEKSFAVNCLSRFGLSYILAEKKLLKPNSTVINILAPGYDYQELDLEDLSLKKLKDKEVWRTTLLLNQAYRDSVVTDSFTMEFNRRYPSIRFYHLFPGYVYTLAPANRGFPFPIPQLSSIFGPILARTIGNTPIGYSDIPLATNQQTEKLNGYLFNQSLKNIKLGKWSSDLENRKKVFEKLVEVINHK